jgi:hypothetical protein
VKKLIPRILNKIPQNFKKIRPILWFVLKALSLDMKSQKIPQIPASPNRRPHPKPAQKKFFKILIIFYSISQYQTKKYKKIKIYKK